MWHFHLVRHHHSVLRCTLTVDLLCSKKHIYRFASAKLCQVQGKLFRDGLGQQGFQLDFGVSDIVAATRLSFDSFINLLTHIPPPCLFDHRLIVSMNVLQQSSTELSQYVFLAIHVQLGLAEGSSRLFVVVRKRLNICLLVSFFVSEFVSRYLPIRLGLAECFFI